MQKAINLLHPEQVLLNTGATADALMGALQRRDYDLVWFAGHSTEQGIELEDGPLDADNLTQFMQSSDAAIFLNSCSSYAVALHINQQLGSAVICTVQDVDDEAAYQTGVLFAHALAKGQTLRDAFDASNTHRTKYLFLPGSSADDISNLQNQVAALSEILGDMQRGRAAEFAELDRRYHPRLDANNARQWMIGFFIYISASVLSSGDARSTLEINYIVASLMGLILFSLSAALLMTALHLDPRKGKFKNVDGSIISMVIFTILSAIWRANR